MRTASDISAINGSGSNNGTTANNNLIIGRLFFAQLGNNNGQLAVDNTYFKTATNYSNATQLTVMAWINLNTYQNYGYNPVIVASSGGPGSTQTFGSNEGAWMLYLRDGRVPAFRAREIEARGENGSIYLATVNANIQDSLPIVSAAVLDENHAKN